MRSWAKKLGSIIAGDPHEFAIEHRNLNVECFSFAVLGIFSSFFNIIFANFPTVYTFSVMGVTLCFSGLYYFSRIKKITHYLNIVFLFLTITILSIIWIYSQGIEGSASFIFLPVLAITFMSFKSDKHWMVITSFLLCLLILFLFQQIQPQIITPYPSKSEQLIDLWFGLVISLIILYFLLTSIKRNYETERTKVESQKLEIEKQNLAIQRKNEELQQKQEEINFQNEKIVQQNLTLEKVNQSLTEASELQSRFFANISHEFRTPLTLIMGTLESLAEKTTDKSLTSEYLLMQKHSSRLLQLINQLLDISKIEKGKMPLTLIHTDINSTINSVVESYSYIALEKNITVSVKEPDNLITGRFDTEKLEKIFYNLLSNAFKFTTTGGKIELVLQKVNLGKSVEVDISDTGIGIPENKLPYIFDRFYQVDGGRNREYEGTGIGLALTKELVELHKGTINVSSTQGQGTSFKIILPLDLEAFPSENTHFKKIPSETQKLSKTLFLHQEPERIDKEDSHTEKEKRTILIVEDNIDMRNHLRKGISAVYKILEASNGKEGIEMAIDNMPDLVLSDIMMPGVDGLQLTKTLKENQLTCHIPVILLTAKADEESKMEGLELLANDYITKPFSLKELLARINSQILNREILRERFAKTISIEPSEITTTSMDEQFLQKVLNVIEKNMSNPDFDVDILCKEMAMSRTNIHLKLKALTNQSTTEFIRSIRLKRAAQLIRQKAGTTTEIAFMTGFNTAQYFSRCFKEYFKVSPSEY